MGCCASSSLKEPFSENKNHPNNQNIRVASSSSGADFGAGGLGGSPVLSEFSLADLKKGSRISLGRINQALRKNILLLMDSYLEGNFSTEEATAVFDLAAKCLQDEPTE